MIGVRRFEKSWAMPPASYLIPCIFALAWIFHRDILACASVAIGLWLVGTPFIDAEVFSLRLAKFSELCA